MTYTLNPYISQGHCLMPQTLKLCVQYNDILKDKYFYSQALFSFYIILEKASAFLEIKFVQDQNIQL